MSTSYGYACVTCDVDFPLYLQYDLACELYQLRKPIKEIENAQPGWISFEFLGNYHSLHENKDAEGRSVPPWEFLHEHADVGSHVIVLLDEYGRRREPMEELIRK